jgi:hypothetical protein
VIAAAITSPLIAPRLQSTAAQSIYMPSQGMPYEAYDALPKTNITIGKSTIGVAFAPGDIMLPKEAVLAWITTAAQAVATYYGHFPVGFVRLLIVPVDGHGVRGGTTWGYAGAAIRMQLGRDVSTDELKHDWRMTHEFVHLALPDVTRHHTWLAEGLAVYIEPIARVQAGDLTAQSIWGDMVRDMPKGLPDEGDKGLDFTPTWARTYWGGALFCLLADVDMRKKTKDQLGLQNAMRGVLAAGGTHEVEWPIGKILDTADYAVGLDVMMELYDQNRAAPVTPDLPKLWRDLGIDVASDGAIHLRDDAPLSATREAITRKPSDG